jgi:formate dehydrogenase assembly factor FdhD
MMFGRLNSFLVERAASDSDIHILLVFCFTALHAMNGAMHDDPTRVVARRIWRKGSPSVGSGSIPEEAAVATTYNGGTYAVMMTTPRDLRDFAVGFSLNEGVIRSPADIDSLDIVHLDDGVELRMWLSQRKADQMSKPFQSQPCQGV